MSKRPRKGGPDAPDAEPPEVILARPVEPRSPTLRPGLEGFERWLRKTMVLKLLVVIVVAFLFKVFVHSRVSFTLGLAVGLAILIAMYLIGYYRRPPHN